MKTSRSNEAIQSNNRTFQGIPYFCRKLNKSNLNMTNMLEGLNSEPDNSKVFTLNDLSVISKSCPI